MTWARSLSDQASGTDWSISIWTTAEGAGPIGGDVQGEAPAACSHDGAATQADEPGDGGDAGAGGQCVQRFRPFPGPNHPVSSGGRVAAG